MTLTDDQIEELIAKWEKYGPGSLAYQAAAALAQVMAERDEARFWRKNASTTAYEAQKARDEAIRNSNQQRHEHLDMLDEASRELSDAQAENAALRQVIEDLRGALGLDARSSVRVAAAAGILAGAGGQSALTGSSVSPSDDPVSPSDEVTESDAPTIAEGTTDDREVLANLIPLGFREHDGVRNVFDAADRILAAGFRRTVPEETAWIDLATIPTDYLRLYVPSDTVVLTVEGATKLRDELTEWIEGR